MLLRSSSTPVLGSLLSSFSDSPSRDFDHNNSNNKRLLPNYDLGHKRNSIFSSGQSSFGSCNSSPVHSGSLFYEFDRKPRSNVSSSSSTGFRRAQSDGNLEGLAAASCDINGFLDSEQQKPLRSSTRTRSSVLQTIPSFSIYSSVDEDDVCGDECDVGIEDNGDGPSGLMLERSVTIGENIGDAGSGEFSFGENMNLRLIKEVEEEIEEGTNEPVSPPLYLARGLGIDSGFIGDRGGNGDGGGGYFNLVEFGDGGHEESGVEGHYKRMVEENPGNPLFLRNYAQFLYQSKGDLHGAEEFYSRAILLDPGDGEILSQYAKLVWELHHDHERASSYFERSVQVAPQDSHVLAAYASFLWETEDENEEDNLAPEPIGVAVRHGTAGMTSASA